MIMRQRTKKMRVTHTSSRIALKADSGWTYLMEAHLTCMLDLGQDETWLESYQIVLVDTPENWPSVRTVQKVA